MDGAQALTKRLNEAERDQSFAPVPIRHAASIIIIDPDGPRVLMGRRSHKHVFMPNQFVFPGGRLDAGDMVARVGGRYRTRTLARLTAKGGRRMTPALARGFGVCAIREAYEETGLLIGRRGGPLPRGADFEGFASRGISLDLSALSFIARAITPPRRPRRFDTRFFAVPRSAVVAEDPSRLSEDAELEAIDWLTLTEARQKDLPAITVTVLEELEERLRTDGAFVTDPPVPFYRMRGDGFVRDVL